MCKKDQNGRAGVYFYHWKPVSGKDVLSSSVRLANRTTWLIRRKVKLHWPSGWKFMRDEHVRQRKQTLFPLHMEACHYKWACKKNGNRECIRKGCKGFCAFIIDRGKSWPSWMQIILGILLLEVGAGKCCFAFLLLRNFYEKVQMQFIRQALLSLETKCKKAWALVEQKKRVLFVWFLTIGFGDFNLT